MTKKPYLIDFTLGKKLLLDDDYPENDGVQVIDIINAMTPEECKEFLTTGCRELVMKEFSTLAVVKRAIDNFDPIFLSPGDFAPEDEYDPESKRIAKKVEEGMPEDKIAEIIAGIFNHAFDADLSKEDCLGPAGEIYYYLTKQ